MSVTVDQNISVESQNTALVSGTADSPFGLLSVEIFETAPGPDTGITGYDMGPATLNADGTWTYDAFFDQPVDLYAVATNLVGESERSDPLLLQGGSPLSNQIESTHFLPYDPATHEIDAYATIFGPSGRALYDVQEKDVIGGQNSWDVTGRGGRGIAYTDPAAHAEVIENFRVAGPSHDKLDLSSSSLQTLADVLRNTTFNQGSATIHVDDITSVTLQGVTKEQIAHHGRDFILAVPQ